MIGAGRLKDDAGDGVRCKPFDQRREALIVIVEARAGALGMEVDIEARFGDVNTRDLVYDDFHLFRVLCLSCEARCPRISVQAKGKERGGHTLARPVTAGRFTTPPLPPLASG
jgi:hypothetical protein